MSSVSARDSGEACSGFREERSQKCKQWTAAKEKFKYKLNTQLSSKQKGNAKLDILRVTLKSEKCHSESNWNNPEKEGLIRHVDNKSFS